MSKYITSQDVKDRTQKMADESEAKEVAKKEEMKIMVQTYEHDIKKLESKVITNCVSIGKILNDANDKLQKKEWKQLIRKLDYSDSTVSRFRKLANNETFLIEYKDQLPQNYGAVCELLQLEEKTLKEKLDQGEITPETRTTDVKDMRKELSDDSTTEETSDVLPYSLPFATVTLAEGMSREEMDVVKDQLTNLSKEWDSEKVWVEWATSDDEILYHNSQSHPDVKVEDELSSILPTNTKKRNPVYDRITEAYKKVVVAETMTEKKRGLTTLKKIANNGSGQSGSDEAHTVLRTLQHVEDLVEV